MFPSLLTLLVHGHEDHTDRPAYNPVDVALGVGVTLPVLAVALESARSLGSGFPTEALALKALVVFDCNTQLIPPRTWERNVASYRRIR